MKNLTIIRKLFLLIAVSSFLLAFSLLASFLLVQHANRVSRETSERIIQTNSDAFQLASLSNRLQNTLQELLREKDIDRIEALVAANDKLKGEALALIQRVSQSGSGLPSAYDALSTANQKILDIVLKGDYAQAQQGFIEESAPAAQNLFRELDQQRDRSVNAAIAERNRSERNLSHIVLMEGMVMLGLLAAYVLLGVSFTRSVVRSLQNTIAMLRDVAEGEADMTRRLAISGRDEMGEMGRLFNLFLDNLQGLIRETKSSALQVNSSALQISSAAEEVAATTEEQSQQVQSVATAVQQLASASDQIAGSIDTTRSTAQEAADKTQQGSEVIRQSLSTLQNIRSQADHLGQIITHLKQSTDKIGGIIGVIDGVADQTNLLALNAAIEAARAGEAGRGFAVVADEVRKLAEHTAKATREISDIITNLQSESSQAASAMGATAEEVKRGTELGEKSLNLLEAIIVSSRAIDEATTSISTAVTQESATIGEINTTIQGIATGTTETARAVHDIASTSERLAHDSEKLKLLVERFKTD